MNEMPKNKKNNAALATVTPIGSAKLLTDTVTAPVTAPVTEVTEIVETPVVAGKKPGPFAGRPVGEKVPYTLPSGKVIESVVTDSGHVCCESCQRRLSAPTVLAADKVAKGKEGEAKRIARLQSEVADILTMLQKGRAHRGEAPLTAEEITALLGTATEAAKTA